MRTIRSCVRGICRSARWNCTIVTVAQLFLFVQVLAQQPNWSSVPTPIAREGAGVVYDQKRGVTVLFGGITGCYNLRSDTWEWDGGRWIPFEGAGPSPRWNTAMAFDERRGRSVLFGGSAVGGSGPGAVVVGAYLQDTWVWKERSWEWLSEGGPSGRHRHALTYDSCRDVIVLFGGETVSSNYFGDTWEFDGNSWKQMVTPVAPSARSGAGFAFDPRHGAAVLYGGLTALGNSAETWIYGPSGWKLAATTGPGPRSDAPLCFDRDRSVILFVGQSGTSTDSWEWDGVRWRNQRAGPPPPVRSQMIYDFGRSVSVVPSGEKKCYALSVMSERSPSMDWTQVRSGAIDPRTQFAAAYDSWRNRLVVHGGLDDSGTFQNDSLAKEGLLWSRPFFGSVSTRAAHAMAFDDLRGVLVLFGGRTATAVLGDTYELGDGVWTRRATTGPSSRQSHAMAFDPAHQYVLLFGGSGTPSGSSLQGDTWKWNGTSWTRVATAGPSARRAASMAFDELRGEVVLFGGENLTAFLGDTWTWNGSVWTIRTSEGPSPRSGASMSFDIGRGSVILSGGRDGSGPIGDTWQWNGSYWEAVPVASPAKARSAMVFDHQRRSLVLFGGGADTDGQLWEYREPCEHFGLVAQSSGDIANALRFASAFVEPRSDVSGKIEWQWAVSSDGPWSVLSEGVSNLGDSFEAEARGTNASHLRVGAHWPSWGVRWVRATFASFCDSWASEPVRIVFSPVDLDGDGIVTMADFDVFSSAYDILLCDELEMPIGCSCDYNHDGVVDDLDWQIFVQAFNADLSTETKDKLSVKQLQELRKRLESGKGIETSRALEASPTMNR
ncbi:MAG: hypothetical protein KF691_04900 [Phycisphaeraceae bacterium]|nr:hypothetical protein [Phycisphaeraceae bacterium]